MSGIIFGWQQMAKKKKSLGGSFLKITNIGQITFEISFFSYLFEVNFKSVKIDEIKHA